MIRKKLRGAAIAAVCATLALVACETAPQLTSGAGGSTSSSADTSTTGGPSTTSGANGGPCVLDQSQLDNCALQ